MAAVFWLASALVLYVVISVLIDQLFNPIRLMTAKLKEVERMRFGKPLTLQTRDEEFREYAAAFNEMSEKLNRHIESQRRFISDAAHELVTPVTIINGHADLLLRHHGDKPEMLEDELALIKSEALRMDGLIESLLLLARSDAGKQAYRFEPVSARQLICGAVSEAEMLAPGFVFKTELEGDFKIRCDENAIKRVLRILLSNAVKYSAEKEPGTVTVGAYVSHGLAHISVTDEGIGIAPEHLPKIFERFYRADDSRAKKTGGSGLGLAIAQELIAAHGGEIHAESTVGEGTKMKVVLPATGN
jgi:signal transduction histidine kinase